MMRTLALSSLLAAAACASQARPKTTLDADTTVPGAEVTIRGSWSKTCGRHTGSSLKSGADVDVDCQHAPIRVQVECGPCEVVGPAVQETSTEFSARVVPLQLGQLVVKVTQTRTDTGEQHVEHRTIDVIPPASFGYHCMSEGSSYGCSEVQASEPIIRPVIATSQARLAGYSRFLRINGKPVPQSVELTGISLAELFPDARVGEGIAPGTYPVELSLGARVERFAIIAR